MAQSATCSERRYWSQRIRRPSPLSQNAGTRSAHGIAPRPDANFGSRDRCHGETIMTILGLVRRYYLVMMGVVVVMAVLGWVFVRT
jgi:hypothetical protein